ncbi:hypothetical protein GNF53_06470 [Clostridium perfringens]|mgnify:CR=1 FL=1|uniref:hypothetical protein n=1 Tax=Clostridium perfringens TaxID=1502 RepID=UPI0018AC410E|nr:hypothetical protein [Clostridium perfringens]EJT6665555.1 hypothetical protein [Clostridium perfringens]MDB2069932.1 hypothetical protein [Clostridium perfringens]MDK0651470.1 hypothetical protein [Clostridium perfringens]MDK0668980.1 hypothetical protein [Clostridium perfringens]MDU4500854.1 hypothetical protein [Clostridium perfringens]
MKNKKVIKSLEIIAIIVLSAVFNAIVSTTTSPIISNIGADSGIFLTIGKSVAEGHSLYVDIFDHKGPVLFFLNAIPQIFIKGPLGVWIVQTVFLIITVILLIKICELLMENKIKYLIPLIYFIYILFTFEGGNLSEEYSNLFCIIGLYIFVKYYVNKFEFKDKYPLILGMCFMAVALIRVNNAALLVSVVLTVLCILLYRKDYKNIWKSIRNFIIGNLVVFIPISTYFLTRNSFYDFMYATFLYNFKYKGNGFLANITNMFKYNKLFKLIIITFILISIINIILLILKSKHELSLFVLINLITTIVAISAGGKAYLHYTTIASIGFMFNIILLFKYLDILNNKFIVIIATCLVILVLSGLLYHKINKIKIEKMDSDNYKKESIELSSHIPRGDSLLGYNIPAKWYYISDLLPSNKYFTLQDWWASFDPSINDHLNDYFDNTPPTWVITDNINNILNNHVKSFIDNNYKLVDENDSGQLYKIKKIK